MSQYLFAKFLQSAKHQNHVSPGSRGPEKMVYKNPLGHKYRNDATDTLLFNGTVNMD
jgi:hypothetical protein